MKIEIGFKYALSILTCTTNKTHNPSDFLKDSILNLYAACTRVLHGQALASVARERARDRKDTVDVNRLDSAVGGEVNGHEDPPCLLGVAFVVHPAAGTPRVGFVQVKYPYPYTTGFNTSGGGRPVRAQVNIYILYKVEVEVEKEKVQGGV